MFTENQEVNFVPYITLKKRQLKNVYFQSDKTHVGPEPSSVTLHCLAFHKLEPPLIVLAATCEARRRREPRDRRLHQDPSYL